MTVYLHNAQKALENVQRARDARDWLKEHTWAGDIRMSDAWGDMQRHANEFVVLAIRTPKMASDISAAAISIAEEIERESINEIREYLNGEPTP